MRASVRGVFLCPAKIERRDSMSEPIIEIRGLRKTVVQGEDAVTALDFIDLSIEK